jgi:hypothetical protein
VATDDPVTLWLGRLQAGTRPPRGRCPPRSVKRILHLIRAIWEREAGDEPD